MDYYVCVSTGAVYKKITWAVQCNQCVVVTYVYAIRRASINE